MELFKRIFHHPNFNAVAGVVTIVSAGLAVYFYNKSIRKPNLTYYISPTRTAIVQKGSLTNNFSVTYQGQSVIGDLSSAEIQIWNQGKKAIHGGDRIHGGDILKTITLKTTNGAPIYTATMSTTRDVVGVSLNNSSNLLSGITPIDFKILEYNDGIKVQLIYGGSVTMPLVLDGIIEGQPQGLTKFQWDGNTFTPFSNIKDTIFFLIAMVPPFIIGWLFGVEKSGRHREWKLIAILFLSLSLVALGWLAGGLFTGSSIGKHIASSIGPPFGF